MQTIKLLCSDKFNSCRLDLPFKQCVLSNQSEQDGHEYKMLTKLLLSCGYYI